MDVIVTEYHTIECYFLSNKEIRVDVSNRDSKIGEGKTFHCYLHKSEGPVSITRERLSRFANVL